MQTGEFTEQLLWEVIAHNVLENSFADLCALQDNVALKYRE